jgi:O-antigen ligase
MFFTLIKGVSSKEIIDTFRYVATFMLAGSLFIGVFFPDFSFAADTYSFGFSNSQRLIGLFNHPRQLGIYALMLFTVELYYNERGLLHKFILIICPIALLLAMAKTAIVLAVIVLFLHISRKGIVPFLVAVFCIIIGIIIFQLSSIQDLSGGNDFSTLTGRTFLWGMLIDNWSDNVFFGSGPAYFGSGLTILPHAHNIILQSISDGGLFGLVGLIGYIIALFKLGLKNAQISNSLSVLLVLLLVLFSMLEPIMRVTSFIDGSFFINLFVVLYLCTLDRERVGRRLKFVL